MSEFRTESDSLGKVRVPKDRSYGAQTARSIINFPIGTETMPVEVITAYAQIKKAAALANEKLGTLGTREAWAIASVCDEMLSGDLSDEFPLVVWQTGSGTQTNMNVNEVIAHRAVLDLHPNDDVNKSQSSNDTFPTAMHLAAYELLVRNTLPGLRSLHLALTDKADGFRDIIKIGRTHAMDATPIRLSQVFATYAAQLELGITSLTQQMQLLEALPLGGTAVGTGLNAPARFGAVAIELLTQQTGHPFVPLNEKALGIATHDALVAVHGVLKTIATSLLKIANDIRLLGSGPRAGLSELVLPTNEPGSSIMPGKVNPTQAEALTMVCAQVLGNDVTINIAGAGGQFELNAFKPVMIYNFLQSARLLGDASLSFAQRCVLGIAADRKQIKAHVENSLMLVTALTPHIGYERAAQIAKKAHAEGSSLRAAALSLQFLSEAEFDTWVRPDAMV